MSYTECCSALGGSITADEYDGTLMCESIANSFSPAVYSSGGQELSVIFAEDACSYLADAESNLQAQQAGGFDFNSFSSGLSNIFGSLGGFVNSLTGFGNTTTDGVPTYQQDADARQQQVIIGFVVVLALIVGGVVISRRRK